MHAPTASVCSLTVLAWRLGALPLPDLWWRYIELGGNCRQLPVAAYLAGTATWPDPEHNVLAHALNEALWDVGCSSLAPYRGHVDLEPEPPAQLPLDLPVKRPERP